tara:strand:+ start:135 stop:728 length:594 start_codon:yes stop_codon:yes gene_type:complete
MTGLTPPSPFILEQIDSWLAARPENEAKEPVELVDLACGKGRHITAIRKRGYEASFKITAVDANRQILEKLTANLEGRKEITAFCLDLERKGLVLAEALNDRLFDLVLVTNYLHRLVLGQNLALVRPGGLRLCETFGKGNEIFGRPSNLDFLLCESELASAVPHRFTMKHQFFGQRRDIYPARPPAIICQFAAQRHG